MERIKMRRRVAVFLGIALAVVGVGSTGLVVSPPSVSAVEADPGRLCGITFSSGEFEPVVTIDKDPDSGAWLGTHGISADRWGKEFIAHQPALAGSMLWASQGMTIPDNCRAGDQAWIDFPNGFHARGANFTDVVDADGHSIATVKTTSRPGSKREATRMVFTLTDYVDTHTDVSASYRFQYQEGWDAGVKPLTTVSVAMTGSDGSSFNTINWRFQGDLWSGPYSAGGWGGDAVTPSGTYEVRSFPSFTGKEDIDLIMTAGPGYDLDCRAFTETDDSRNQGIGLVDIGPRRDSAPLSATRLAPSAYTVQCSNTQIRLHMPASSWTSADAESGQVLRVVVARRPNRDTSWQADGGVIGLTNLRQTGHREYNRQWFNAAPGSSATGRGLSLKQTTTTAPTVQTSQQCGEVARIVTGKEEGVAYEVSYSEDRRSATISAAPKPGYYIDPDATTTWTLKIPEPVACPVDAALTKKWDEASSSWILTVKNPSGQAQSKSLTLVDEVTLVSLGGKVSDLSGETISQPSIGVVTGNVWKVPALNPKQSATAIVKAREQWLAHDGGRLINHLAPQGDMPACLRAAQSSNQCAISETALDVDPVVQKKWDQQSRTWVLTVRNPSREVPARSLTLRDNVTITDSKGKTTDVSGERIVLSGKAHGKINADGTWETPRLQPGKTATAVVKARDEWLSAQGGTVTNYLGRDSDKECLNGTGKKSKTCVSVRVSVDVDPSITKTWNADTKKWTITATNPSKQAWARPLTVADNLFVKGNDESITDITGETITLANREQGTINDDGTWTTPRLKPGQTVTAMVDARDEWLRGDGVLVNRAGKSDANCLKNPQSEVGECAQVVTQREKVAERTEKTASHTLPLTGVNVPLAIMIALGLVTIGGCVLAGCRHHMR